MGSFQVNRYAMNVYLVICSCNWCKYWRKRKSYYERLQFGHGVRTCIWRNGVCCKNVVHLEIVRCGVAYLCRNEMCYKAQDAEWSNWMCLDCYLAQSGGCRKKSWKWESGFLNMLCSVWYILNNIIQMISV